MRSFEEHASLKARRECTCPRSRLRSGTEMCFAAFCQNQMCLAKCYRSELRVKCRRYSSDRKGCFYKEDQSTLASHKHRCSTCEILHHDDQIRRSYRQGQSSA